MGTFSAGLAAFIVGSLLAGATAFGVVQSQVSAGRTPINVSNVGYGK